LSAQQVSTFYRGKDHPRKYQTISKASGATGFFETSFTPGRRFHRTG
jgi:hypothetical protein